ncbi:hypothetical protein AYO45_05125 [Gammaproteobacteria bacterium SCGC AG-212-F23]|nr:hypothetical protein AYO45_05125 [Gammaproteobacteria bacterium SCGC AG-212-F23]
MLSPSHDVKHDSTAVPVFQDCCIQVDLTTKRVYQLNPYPNETIDPIYGDRLNTWNRGANIPAVTSSNLESKTLEIVSINIKTCHTVIIKKTTAPIYWMMHVSPQASRRGYDTQTKTAIDKQSPPTEMDIIEASGMVASDNYGALGLGHLTTKRPLPQRSRDMTDNNIRPAYIEVDSSYYPNNPGIGLKAEDEIDVYVVHTGIAFDKEILTSRLSSLCKIRALHIETRDRSKLVENPDPNKNCFYEVALNITDINPKPSTNNPKQHSLIIRSNKANFYSETIADPLNFPIQDVVNIPRMLPKPPEDKKNEKDEKDEKKAKPITATFEKGTLGDLLIKKYGALPQKFKNDEESFKEPVSDFFVILNLQYLNSHFSLNGVWEKTITLILNALLEYEKNNNDNKYVPLNAIEYGYFLPTIDLEESGHFKKASYTVYYNRAKEYQSAPKPLLAPDFSNIDREDLFFHEKIIKALEKYCYPTGIFRSIQSWRRHHFDTAKPLLEFIKKNKNAEPVQLKNLIYSNLYKFAQQETYSQIRRGINYDKINLNHAFFQTLLYTITVCEKAMIPQSTSVSTAKPPSGGPAPK